MAVFRHNLLISVFLISSVMALSPREEAEQLNKKAYKFFKDKQYTEAIDTYFQVIARDPTSSFNHKSIPMVRPSAAERSSRDSILNYIDSVKHEPALRLKDAAYYNIACAYSLLKVPQKALLPLLESYYRNPERKDKIRVDPDLKEFRASPYYAIVEKVLEIPKNRARELSSLVKLVQGHVTLPMDLAREKMAELSDEGKKQIVFVMIPDLLLETQVTEFPIDPGYLLKALQSLKTSAGKPVLFAAFRERNRWDNIVKNWFLYLYISQHLDGPFMSELLTEIGKSGSESWPYEEVLRKMSELKDDDASRTFYIRLFSAGAGAAPQVVPTLIYIMEKDESCRVRILAIRKLGEIGKPAERAINALKSVLTQFNSCMFGDRFDDQLEGTSVAHHAAEALKSIGTPAALEARKEWKELSN